MSANTSESRLVEQMANGAWTRLRNLIGALDRMDRLETSDEFVGWLQGLAKDEIGLQENIREFLLRALRLAGDPVNSRILMHLHNAGAATTTELSQATKLARVELVERINELARAGLTVQALDGDQIEATPFALGFLSLVNEITAQMKTLALQDHLLNPLAPSPKLPIDRANIQKLRSKI